MKHVDHVGIAVRDIDEARRIWDPLLGQTPVVEDVASQKVRTAIYPCGIELVAPMSPDSPISPTSAMSGSTRWLRNDDAIAVATARSAAGSVIRIPPTTLT